MDVNIAAAIMVKNESARIAVTLQSIVDVVDKIIIYDTGSEDDTIEIITDFCSKNGIKLYLKCGEFINFSVSRNVMLRFADTIDNIDYLLLLDCNDELQNGLELIKICNNLHDSVSGLFIKQQWKASHVIEYFNVKLIRPRIGWKYVGAVHEYIDLKNSNIVKVPDIIIFQDRTQDDLKSFFRFSKDKELLLTEYNSENRTSRTVYYLAQTFECLDDKENAIHYFKDRLFNYDGFIEEKYHAAYRTATLLKSLQKSFVEYSGYFLMALQIMYRAEPLVRIAEYYISTHSWESAFTFLNNACKIPFPDCGLFVDSEMYHYYRWHLMGIVAYYVKEYDIGFKACIIAVHKRRNKIDINNLQYYKNELSGINNISKLQSL